VSLVSATGGSESVPEGVGDQAIQVRRPSVEDLDGAGERLKGGR
jgi:hypothetical protein